jgi:hypothetical protein
VSDDFSTRAIAEAVRRHPGTYPASAAARSWRGAIRMSQQTAQSRSRSDHPGGFRSPRAENGAVLGILGLQPPLERAGPGPSGLGRSVKSPTNVYLRPGRGTMALHGPAAEPGQVEWEMSLIRCRAPPVQRGSRLVVARQASDHRMTIGGA